MFIQKRCQGHLQHIDWCLWRSWHGYQISMCWQPFIQVTEWCSLQGWGQEWKAAVGYLRHSGLQGLGCNSSKTLQLLAVICASHAIPYLRDLYLQSISIHPCRYLSIWRSKKTRCKSLRSNAGEVLLWLWPHFLYCCDHSFCIRGWKVERCKVKASWQLMMRLSMWRREHKACCIYLVISRNFHVILRLQRSMAQICGAGPGRVLWQCLGISSKVPCWES